MFADWLVFSVLNSSEMVYGSNALKLLLDQRPDLARDKRVVVFTYDVPYGLDVTDISKIDVYYALYSQGHPFIDMAAHLLFLELSAISVTSPPVGCTLTRKKFSPYKRCLSWMIRKTASSTRSAKAESSLYF